MLGLASAAVWLAGGWATGEPGSGLLIWDALEWPQRPWTLWTASFVHLSGGHLLANLLALTALAVLGWSLRAGTAATVALLLAWPLGTLSLLLWPAVKQYSGLSGLVHAAVAVLWAHAALDEESKPLSFILFAALGLKLLTEHAWSLPLAFDVDWGFNVVYAAHLGGALAGAGCGLLAGLYAHGIASHATTP
jgi:rhomboid family GlyGly-CTERM serine protease